jgi:hypothetical protein
MTEQKKQDTTPKGQVSFPHLFEKEKFEDNEPKFSVTLCFPKDTDLSKLKQMAKKAVEETWPVKKPRGLKSPFKDGDAVDENGDLKYPYDGYEGCIVLKCSSKYDVGVVDKNKMPITDPDEVYGGCYGRAFVQAAAYDLKSSKGVTFYLVHFQKLEDCPEDERFGNGKRTSAQDAFDDELSEDSDASRAFGDDGTDDPFGV